ncbi:MAG TPA: Uma2 family endonuclease [Stellaceae bacterium]|nr:Uma2 family endonuclease [Stellaceae bacterium]
MEVAYKLLTVEEFLDACPNDQRHYQLFDGVIVAMAPPGDRHQRIAGVLGGLLYNAVAVKSPGCAVLIQAGIAPQGTRGRDHFETDFTITCEPPRDDRRGIVDQPLLIVEILSPGTDRDDVFVKLPAYQRIASLREILYVETERMGATVYRRDGGNWAATVVGERDRLRLETIRIDVALADLYRGVPGLTP